MKKRIIKKTLIYGMIAILSFSIIGFFAYYLIKLNRNNVQISETSSEFANGSNIVFSSFDKIYIIQTDGNHAYFIPENFKALFLLKLLDLAPESQTFNLKYQMNSENNPNLIRVTYTGDNKKDIFWGYKIID